MRTGYTPEVTLQLAKDLEPYNLKYFEQPMPDENIADSARIRTQTSTPLALNESVTTLAHVCEILELNAADYLLPDTYQCGGILAVKRIIDVAASADVPCVFHCSHDFGLKTAAMLHVAASSPNMPLANDCTYYALESDILQGAHRITRGTMPVPKPRPRRRSRHGIGPQVSRQVSGARKSIYTFSEFRDLESQWFTHRS
ncbi:MAG: enolase C-terminal domain-like protein [Planctomycetaceae bacterium]